MSRAVYVTKVSMNNNYKDDTNIDIYVDVLHSEPLENIPFQSEI